MRSTLLAALYLLLAFAPRANALHFVPGDLYSSNYFSTTISHYTSSGALLESLTLPPSLGSETRGMAFGPDGRLYVVMVTGANFGVVALDSAGVVQATFSGPGYVAGNLSFGKIAFGGNGQFFVAGADSLVAFTSSSSTGSVIYTSNQVFDVKPLPWGNLLVLSAYGLVEITAAGSVVRAIGPDTLSLVDARGVEFDPLTHDVYVTMLGYSGEFFQLMRLDGNTGHLKKSVFFWYGDDMFLTSDRRLVVGSRTQAPGIFDLDLNQIGSLAAGDQMFVTGFPYPSFAANDFNSDGKSDMVWRNVDGRTAISLMNGATPLSVAEITGPGIGWSVTHVADFNGDGKADLLWQHPDGRAAISLMNGTAASSTKQVLDAGTGWTVTHTLNLNGDGHADLLFRHADGSVAAGTMSGTTMTGGASILGPGTGWSVSRTADFDGDGKDDLLATHTDGRVAILLMDGTATRAFVEIFPAGTGWSVTQTPDLDGDGRADIVWQHVDGSIAVWLMNGVTMTAGTGILGPGTGWSVTSAADFDGDGKFDLLGTHTDGRVAILLMNGTAIKASAVILPAGTGWSVTQTLDLDGDGKADIAWQNADGSAATWLMNGLTMTAGTGILGPGTGWSASGRR